MSRGRIAAGAALLAGLAAATFPAWRVLALGPQPTAEELLSMRCSAAEARPPSWWRPASAPGGPTPGAPMPSN